MEDRVHPNASDYEWRAWTTLVEQERSGRDRLIGRAGDKLGAATKRVGDQIRKFRPAERVLQIGGSPTSASDTPRSRRVPRSGRST